LVEGLSKFEKQYKPIGFFVAALPSWDNNEIHGHFFMIYLVRGIMLEDGRWNNIISRIRSHFPETYAFNTYYIEKYLHALATFDGVYLIRYVLSVDVYKPMRNDG
jgi:hypothetical protein